MAIILMVVLAIMFIWFVLDIQYLYQTGAIRPNILGIRRAALQRPALVPQQIESWMTFRYINYVFRLPVNYLPAKLNISNSHYPNITLDNYVDTHKLNGITFTALVRQTVAEYISGVNK